MDIHSKRKGQKFLDEIKSFSFKDHGISAYHAAPAALMVAAGIALSAVISDVPPEFNKVFASSVEITAEENGNFTQDFDSQVNELLFDSIDPSELAEAETMKDTGSEVSYMPSLAADICTMKKSENSNDYNFTAHLTGITEEAAEKKLEEVIIADRERELEEAKGQSVASSNRNLYLDTYRYQGGISNIPLREEYNGFNYDGEPISQFEQPSTLTFDENGVPENYLYCIEGMATAYTGGGRNSTGTWARPGAVAVDPRDIPYGTEMWIVSADGEYVYGYARAEDTGGFIYFRNGAVVDLYMNSEWECSAWGWRGVKIYVLPTYYK